LLTEEEKGNDEEQREAHGPEVPRDALRAGNAAIQDHLEVHGGGK
jgi:hypothetical protein